MRVETTYIKFAEVQYLDLSIEYQIIVHVFSKHISSQEVNIAYHDLPLPRANIVNIYVSVLAGIDDIQMVLNLLVPLQDKRRGNKENIQIRLTFT